MQINLNKINLNERIFIDENITFDLSVYQNKDIKELNDIHVKGEIYYSATENLEINLTLTGNMTLIDSVTLEDINYPLNLKISEEYSLEDEIFKEYYEKEQNILDIMAILWENIVLEVPMRFTSAEDLELSGEGWRLGERNEHNNIDPRLAELAQILDERKE